jgi:hypothetical protein
MRGTCRRVMLRNEEERLDGRPRRLSREPAKGVVIQTINSSAPPAASVYRVGRSRSLISRMSSMGRSRW